MSVEASWDHLRSLLAFARAGTLSQAARALGVKHSTVSRHIAELERSIGSQVVHRGPDGLTLTTAGERLMAAAEGMEGLVRQAQDDIAGRDRLIQGTVRIGAPDAFGSIFLAPRIAPLAAQHPALNIQLVALPRVFNLTKREADLAVALAVPQHGRLMAKKLADYGLGLYASPRYLAASRPIRTLDDLRGHQFINYIDELITIAELDYLDEVSPHITARFQSSSILAQLYATVSGFGLCVLPYFLAKQQPGLVNVLGREVVLTRTWWLLVHEDQNTLSRVRLVHRFIYDTVRQNLALLQAP
ncbi:LysR family transcriptional regulator [Methylobacterium oryzisoli]|uniref:LysR family transcriptional regulator n=1 Tax=Methylobacterium oryzisoli TaxID=3385502 RepID=UPI003892C22C